MKTIAQQLNIKEFPFEIKDKDGKYVYFEDSDGYWEKREYKDGKQVYFEASRGYWWRCEYKDDNQVYYEDSSGFWLKREFNADKEVYREGSSRGVIFDKRSKATEVSMGDIAKKFGVSVEDLKIKKD